MTNKTNSSQIENFLFVITLLLVFIIAGRAPLDNDLWWHLRSGELTWQTKQPTLTDHFSYTRIGQPWINHSWLSQVILYGIFIIGSFPALAAFTALAAVISMGLVYTQCEGPALLKASVVLLGAMVASMVWSPRPQMFSLLLFAYVGYLLNRYKKNLSFPLWIFPLTFIIWSNLHGGYPLGIMLIGVFIIGETAESIIYPGVKGSLERRQIIKLISWTMCSIAVLLFNPNGIDTWVIPFKTINIAALRNLVSEWASPDFHDPAQQLLLALCVILFFSITYSNQKLGWAEFLMIILFGGMAFVSRRNFGPFAIAVTPILSRHLCACFQKFHQFLLNKEGLQILHFLVNSPISDKKISFQWQRIVNLSFIIFLAVVCCLKLFVVTYPPLYQNYLKRLYPVDAVNWLKNSELPGNLFNEYDWGGYLIWNLRDRQVFLDGRTDLFGDEIIDSWIDIVQAQANWKESLEKWKVNLIIIRPDRPAARVLPLIGWRTVYEDQAAVILTRKDN